MKSLTFVFLLIFFSSCEKGKTIVWGNAAVDRNIPNNPIYQKLDAQKEILAIYEHDTLMRRTSDVIYTEAHDSTNFLNASKFYNCRAYFFNPEILTINIGLSSGLGGNGFVIHYKDDRFYVEPYFYTDLNLGEKKEPDYIVIEQILTLDKRQYNIGDSLYGKIDFHILKIENGRQTEHCADGFFRTKISKP